MLRWRELVARAGSPEKAKRLLRQGAWRWAVRDAYVPADLSDEPALRVAVLQAVLPAHAVLSHRTALWVLGVDVLQRERQAPGARGAELLDVTVPRGLRCARRPGVRTHSADLPDEELCEIGGLLAVSAARAFVDVARSEPLVEAVAFGDAVLRSGAGSPDQLLAALDRAGGLRHVRRAREVVPHLEPRSESLMESRFRMRLVLGGVPRPDAQLDVYDDGGHVGRADLHLDGVLLEYDGREARLDRTVFVHERRRQNRMADLGCEIRRFTSADYYRRPAAVVCAEVLRAVEVARGRDRSRLRRGPDTLRPPRLRPLPTRAAA